MIEFAILIVVLPLSTRDVPEYITQCRLIISMLADNPNFLTPTPPLLELSADVDTLAACEELARKGGKGMVQQRDLALRTLHIKMLLLRAYVQTIANADPERAEVIVHSAGMSVAKPRARSKQLLNARHGNAPGRVVLDAKALPSPVQYRWQMSTDQATWTDLSETFKTKTVVDGLVPATMYSFRLRTVTNNGPSEWSSPVTIIAH